MILIQFFTGPVPGSKGYIALWISDNAITRSTSWTFSCNFFLHIYHKIELSFTAISTLKFTHAIGWQHPEMETSQGTAPSIPVQDFGPSGIWVSVIYHEPCFCFSLRALYSILLCYLSKLLQLLPVEKANTGLFVWWQTKIRWAPIKHDGQ